MKYKKKVTRYRMFTLMQYLKHPDTGKSLYSEDESLRLFESLLKNGLTLSTNKDPRSGQSSKPTAIALAGTPTVETLASEASAYPKGCR